MSGINRLDLKQLRVLQLLLQQGNLSQVARTMGLTQQAISEQLRKLRNTFDDQMFIRTSNGVTPTPLAQSLRHKVNNILTDINSLVSAETFEPSQLHGVLQISTSDYALVTVLPMLLSRVHALAPQLKIIIRDFESDNLNQLMSTGELDFVITFPEFIPDNFPHMLLFKEHHVCVTGRESVYKGKKYTVGEIAKMPQLIVSPSRPNLKGSHDAWFAKRGYKRNIVLSVPSFSSAPGIIAATNTIGFLPSRLLPDPKVVPIELAENPPSFDVIVAWHQRSNNSPMHQWLLGLLKDIYD